MKDFIFREYQHEGFKAAVSSKIGRLVMPTGSGKTFLEAATIGYHHAQSIDTMNISLALVPRIVLANQLIEEYRKVLTQGRNVNDNCGNILFTVKKQVRFIAFHSGEYDIDYCDPESGWTYDNWSEIATTSIQAVFNEIAKAINLNQEVVIVSTYHSCHKLNNLVFCTAISDESQYLVQKDFFDNYSMLNAQNKYFFTATEKYTKDPSGRGLNNESFYGKILYKVLPKTLIEKGYITDVGLHIMTGSSDDRKSTFLDEVKRAVEKQEELSSLNDCSTKLLFATPGTEFVKIVSHNYKKLRGYCNYPIYTCSSKNGYRINGQKVKRNDFLKRMKQEERFLVFHYDILSEGIDVPGLTGVVIMRNMNLIKLMQTLGRAMRLQAGKKKAWVTMSNISNDYNEMVTFITEVVSRLREEGYDLSFEEIHLSDVSEDHDANEVGLDDAYNNIRISRSSKLLKDVKHLVRAYEENSEWENVETYEEALDIFFKET